MAKVSIEHVSKVYRDDKGCEVRAADDVSLEINDREFMVLVGPSGCGKSTTLRMVAGLEEISSGTIQIDGRVVNDVPPKDRDLAMVFQNYALYPHMTVYKNMAFGLKLRKYPQAEISQRVNEAAEILGLRDLLERRPKELSGGQRQRVAVGRAIVRKPKVFLFDEPLSNLDAKMRVQMRAEISKLHTRLAATMIYVTHDQVEAMTMGDRITVMNKGRVQQVGAPLDIYNHPRNLFVAGFIGTPPMNFFEGSIQRSSGGLHFIERNGGQGAPISLRIEPEHAARLEPHAEKELVMGIRPEDIRVARGAANPSCKAQATVEVIEPMGAEIYLYLNTGAHSFIARIGTSEKPVVNARLDLTFDMAKSHFFDKATQEAVL